MLRSTIARQTRKRLLFINYFGTIGGGQVQLLSLLANLNQDVFQPMVVCCQAGEFIHELRKLNIYSIIVPFPKGKLRNLHYSIPAIWKLLKIVKKYKIDLIHAHGLQEAKLGTWVAKFSKRPLVWVVAP